MRSPPFKTPPAACRERYRVGNDFQVDLINKPSTSRNTRCSPVQSYSLTRITRDGASSPGACLAAMQAPTFAFEHFFLPLNESDLNFARRASHHVPSPPSLLHSLSLLPVSHNNNKPLFLPCPKSPSGKHAREKHTRTPALHPKKKVQYISSGYRYCTPMGTPLSHPTLAGTHWQPFPPLLCDRFLCTIIANRWDPHERRSGWQTPLFRKVHYSLPLSATPLEHKCKSLAHRAVRRRKTHIPADRSDGLACCAESAASHDQLRTGGWRLCGSDLDSPAALPLSGSHSSRSFAYCSLCLVAMGVIFHVTV